jgi:molybdenum cofactor guanylyltransferase
MLLTGGASRRMGTDKALLRIDGMTMANRLGHLLSLVTSPTIEVGPGHSVLSSVADMQSGQGPLVGITSGILEFERLEWFGPAVILACDLPLLDEAALRLLTDWPGEGSVVPVVDGHPQPLCARWSRVALQTAVTLAKSGQRSLKGLPMIGPGTYLHEQTWGEVVSRETFSDVDDPQDLLALGLQFPCEEP